MNPRLLASLLGSVVLIAGCTSGSTGGSGSPTPARQPAPAPAVSPAASPSASPSPSQTASPTSAAVASPSAAVGEISNLLPPPGPGPANVVRVINHEDGRFDARGKVQLDQLDDPNVEPSNYAAAEGSCTNCQTIAVAVQVVLYRVGAPHVAPQNQAFALNVRCTNCHTVALAFQYVIPVDDPHEVREDVQSLVRDLNHELQYFQTIHSVSELNEAQARARLDQIINQYQQLVQYLNQAQDDETAGDSPTPTAAPTSSPTVVATTPTPGPTGTASPSPSATAGSTPQSPATAPATNPGPATASPSPTP